MSIADILDKAADLIEPEGAWSTWSGYCASAAIARCGGGYPERLFFRSFLGAKSIVEWNDAPERTQAEVVAKLRSAAALARDAESMGYCSVVEFEYGSGARDAIAKANGDV